MPTRVDLHVKTLDEDVVARAKARGLDALVYAPHFVPLPETRERARRHADDDLLVVPGREVFTGSWRSRRHVLGVGLDDPVPDFVTLDGALAEFERQDAATLVPHPEFINVSLDRGDVADHRDRIDAVELYNGKLFGYQNGRGRRIAADLGLPGYGSSYAHLLSTVGEVWTEFAAEIETETDLVDALREGVKRRVVHRPGVAHRVAKAVEFAHLGFENSWGKVDRLLLTDREATHPAAPLYEGRFDDVRVY